MFNIHQIAELISHDPNDHIDPSYLYRRHCDRLLALSVTVADTIAEENITDEYDTIGDLDYDYPIFMDSLLKNDINAESLTLYSKSDYEAKGARLYKLKGIDAGFAVTHDGDVISVHNSEPRGSKYKGIGRYLAKSAREKGGHKLDHYDFPHLNHIYSSEGFKERDRVPWDDRYAPQRWNYTRFGKPDLIFRSL